MRGHQVSGEQIHTESFPRTEFITMCIAVKFILTFSFIKYYHRVIISFLFITPTHIAFTLQLGTPGTLQTLAHAEAAM